MDKWPKRHLSTLVLSGLAYIWHKKVGTNCSTPNIHISESFKLFQSWDLLNILHWTNTSLNLCSCAAVFCLSPGFCSCIKAFIVNQLTLLNRRSGCLVWCCPQQSAGLTDACICSFSVSEVLFWDGCVMMATVWGICDIGMWKSLPPSYLSFHFPSLCLSCFQY